MNPKTIELLPQKQVEQYAKNYKRDRLFVEEENECTSQLKEAKGQIEGTNKEIKCLGVKSNPGYQPDYSPFVWPVCKIVGILWGVGIVLVFVFHCLIWLLQLIFNIPWDTWGWVKSFFMYGLYTEIICFLGGSIIYGIVYWIWMRRTEAYNQWKSEMEALQARLSTEKKNVCVLNRSLANIDANRQNILLYAYKLILSLPIRTIAIQDLEKAHNKFFELLERKESLKAIDNPKEKLDAMVDFYNTQLALFYHVSVPSEATSQDALDSFNVAVDGLKNPRGLLVLSETEENHVGSLVKQKSHYTSTSLDSEIDEFKELLEMNTSGVLTKVNSRALEKQVTKMNSVYNSAVTFYKGFDEVRKRIIHTLGVVRLVAYRNIYLGAELLNVVREGAGGGKLTTAFDSIDNSVKLTDSNIEITSFTMTGAIGDVVSAGLNSVANILDNRTFTRYAAGNPKQASLAVAGVAAISMLEKGIEAWERRQAKIEGLKEHYKELSDNMKALVDSYLKNYSSTERAVELIAAIVNANQGFMSIYNSISKKVFIDKSLNAVTMAELQQLTQAIGAYKKISDSKL